MLKRFPGRALERNRFPTRRELPSPPPLDDCALPGRTEDGRMRPRALPLGALADAAAAVEAVPLEIAAPLRNRENRFDPLEYAAVLDGAGAACGALLVRFKPLKRRVLVSALPPMAGVAVMVGVKSDRDIMVALLATKFFRFGANDGRFRDANGRMTGVNVRFFVANVKRDFLRPFSSISSSFSSSLPSPPS